MRVGVRVHSADDNRRFVLHAMRAVLSVREGGPVGKGGQNSDEALVAAGSYEVTPPDPTARYGRSAAASPKPTGPRNDTHRVSFACRSDLEPDANTASSLFGERRLEAFLKRHGYTRRKAARELLGRLRNAAQGRAGDLEMQTRREMGPALVSALEPVVARISKLTIEIRHALEAHPDGPTFRPLFIAPDSWLWAATMIAEIGDCRERYPSYDALAADCGQAPIAVESGKAKHAQFRWASDHRLRAAFCTLADSSRRHNRWAPDIYDHARARGASHTHATRILGRA
jgi:Transposase IS116/IS110/IS902 family